ncbi:probable L-type lectin-domain containing receptor kinase S.5 [Ziziphus jujuba]|uniref:Probable L-type lectin-domain containing receptor kinase S.5 n=1 Tax=Ziziphus jujuba TaxID=326968 RepID=A0ABM4A962_ZIZJJ|nr:probable L-type lectin-domain containing receptor kinase S.5 [Ziziphus jujuba]
MGSVIAGNGHLNLTPEPEDNNSSTSSLSAFNKVGRVLYRYPVLAWPAMITTTFTVRISTFPNATGSGDGMAFVIAQDNHPSPPDSYGSYLGLLDRSTQDTFMNEFDIDGNHIGIDTTSTINTVASKSLNSTRIDLKSGRDIKLKIDYDGLNQMLYVYVSYSSQNPPLTSFLNHKIVMSHTVPQWVYVGFTASTGTLPESHQLLDWVFTSVPLPLPTPFPHSKTDSHKENKMIKTILVIAIPLFLGLLILLVYLHLRGLCRNERNEHGDDIESRSRIAASVPKLFTYKQLSKATNKFNKENLLGKGGFGSVYKGIISDPPQTIAVKKISATSEQGEREYLAEICTIGRLRHKNIVKLLGWCNQGKHLLLVYEYMPNGSLDKYIGKVLLDWKTRYKILTGLATALLYLHEDCGSPVVHRDIKPNNIMLDSDYNAHLGDFGLARLLQNDKESATTMLAGTPGYLAPEVGFTGKATPESDVYSFGMVVLEVVCGKRSTGMMEENSLVDHVWILHEKNSLVECVDKMMEGKFEEKQVKRLLVVGLACLLPDSMARPKIRKVLQILLNPNEPLMDLPETRPSSVCIAVTPSASTITDLGPKSGSVIFGQ